MNTSALFDEAARQARAETIARETVVALRSDVSGPGLTLEQRRKSIVQTLERAVMQLEIAGDTIADAEMDEFIGEIEARLALRHRSVRERLELVPLAGEMGRAP